LRSEGTEKPANKALEDLVDLLENPGPRFETSSLDYALSGDLQDIHCTLLQKRNGRFYLLLWQQDVPSYSLEASCDVSMSARKLTLNQPIDTATIHLPNVSTAQVTKYSTPGN
jgi:hypothetical protein